MTTDDRVHLPEDDFRRERALLAPHLFADPGTGHDLPPTEIVSLDAWTGLVDLPTDVLLRTTSHEGSSVDALHSLTTTWTFLTPMEETTAPYVFESALLANDEFDALAFITLNGYYRQALGCLRNALEVLTIGAGLAIKQDPALFARWRNGEEVKFGNARDWLAASPEGTRLDGLAAPPPSSTGRYRGRGSRGCISASAATRIHVQVRTTSTSGKATVPSTCGGCSTGSSWRRGKPWCSAWSCCVSAGRTSP